MNIHRIAARREGQPKRVAAYARVSTRSADQEESFETQVRCYTEYIRADPRWIFAGVFADHGITGVNAKVRPDFQRMIHLALSGEIDLILVKSISRFSRNIVDCQRIISALKDAGVEVRFEREGISTFDPSAGFIFSVLSAVAQDESRSISENVRWACQQRFARGEYCLGDHRVLGYDTDPVTRKLIPNQDAWIIRLIFERYAAGATYRQIASELNARGAKRLRSDRPFEPTTLRYILRNEVYVGDRRLQKRAPVNFLTKRPDPAIPYESFYLHEDHEGIVGRSVWERVQARIANGRTP